MPFRAGGLVVATIGLWATHAIPEHLTSLGFMVLVVILGIVPAGWAPRTAGTLGATVTPEELQRYDRPVLLEVSRDPAFVEASNWAARNVAGDEVIIVPPWWEGFRISSGAAVYGT